jgi:cytochrome b pre-mRNA-processing protein 3
MIWPFKKRHADNDREYALYNDIVAQSRREKFYAEMGVPDTVTGRFDIICLNMCIVLRRLRTAKGGNAEFTQALFDLFFKDMDRSLREMGVSDVAIPKRIEKMGGLFYGLLEKVTAALDAEDGRALAAVLGHNILADAAAPGAAALADYAEMQAKALDAQDAADIEAGNPAWKES